MDPQFDSQNTASTEIRVKFPLATVSRNTLYQYHNTSVSLLFFINSISETGWRFYIITSKPVYLKTDSSMYFAVLQLCS